MITLHGQSQRLCDGMGRRDFLRVGALGLGGLGLADVLRLRAEARQREYKSVIMIVLTGGPSHIDLYDLKPEAPVEYRGELQPIRTTVPGFDISELLPLQANQQSGRDHWQESGCALLAGGGLKVGQVIGATDRHAVVPRTRPITPQNVLATLYRLLGIDPAATIPNFSGRPMHLLDDREPVAELV